MFTLKDRPNSKNTETIIGPSVKVKGDFTGEGDIIVEGEVEGSLKTKQNLLMGTSARIQANVQALNAHISGEILGNIKVEKRITLTSSAKITGDVESKILIVEEGAVINGKLVMNTETSRKSETKPTTNHKYQEKGEQIDK